MSNMLELFLPKAWLVAHQAGNNDNLRLAMAEIVKKGEHSLQVGPVSEERNNVILALYAKGNKGHSIG